MLTLNVKIEGDRVVIDGLKKLQENYPGAVKRGLRKIVIGTNRQAVDNLGGAGAMKSNARAGSYPPVPVRTGHLRRSQNFVLPGMSKTSGEQTFSAGPFEAVLYNAALYSRAIHEGKGSSEKYGSRPFQTDAVEKYDRSGKLISDLDEEIQKEIQKL